MFSRTMFWVGSRPVFALRATTWQSSLRQACPAVAGAASEGWWSQTGSNRRPHACKARALPAELWPRTRRRMLCWHAQPKLASTSPPSPHRASKTRVDALYGLRRGSLSSLRERRLVGLGRLELPTSRLSSARSNQLSYKPLTLFLKRIGNLRARNRLTPMHAQAQPLARVRPRRKRNEDGEIPPMELNNPDCWPLMFLKR